ncbi:MAG: ATP-binding cassette domain-containing protein [Blastocatellia bacterium]|nr:ATP-binding cassette domain-containing protein [Blastocatellia bacterium]
MPRRFDPLPKQDPFDKKAAARDAWRLFLRYGRPYLGSFLLAVGCLLVAGGLALSFPYFVGKLVDSAFTYKDLSRLNETLVLLVGILTVQAIFSFGRTYLINSIGEQLVADIREDLYAHLMRLSLNFFANRRVGELTSRISSDITVLQSGTTANLAEGLRQIIVLTGGVTLMFVTNARLSLILLSIIPFLVVAAAVFGKRIRRISTRVQDKLGEAAGILDESLSSIRTVQSFTNEEYEIQRYRTQIRGSLREAVRRALARGGFNAFIVFVLFNGIVLLLWLSGKQAIEGTMSVGQVTSFFLYTSVVGTALGAFTELSGEFNQTLGASRRVVELFGTPLEIADAADAQPLARVKGNVEFRDVVFAYPGRSDVPVLKNVSITARSGEVIALVGPSGAGKSTVISLIPRFYDVQSGSILVDGVDVRQCKLHDLRRHIGIVPQETTLFSGTIRENIAYGKLTATTEQVEAAAQAANAHDFIMAFPDGYGTLVGERGVKLSGGQRQRIAIARAILKNPEILILDEATSSLDSESEGLVQTALEALMRGRTTFVIAHRLSTVRNADRILVMEAGQIVESGTHERLLEQNGLYRKLYSLQFRELDEFSPSEL